MRDERTAISVRDRGFVHDRKESIYRFLGRQGPLKVRRVVDKLAHKHSCLFGILRSCLHCELFFSVCTHG